jgi:hypothetical protein
MGKYAGKNDSAISVENASKACLGCKAGSLFAGASTRSSKKMPPIPILFVGERSHHGIWSALQSTMAPFWWYMLGAMNGLREFLIYLPNIVSIPGTGSFNSKHNYTQERSKIEIT